MTPKAPQNLRSTPLMTSVASPGQARATPSNYSAKHYTMTGNIPRKQPFRLRWRGGGGGESPVPGGVPPPRSTAASALNSPYDVRSLTWASQGNSLEQGKRAPPFSLSCHSSFHRSFHSSAHRQFSPSFHFCFHIFRYCNPERCVFGSFGDDETTKPGI